MTNSGRTPGAGRVAVLGGGVCGLYAALDLAAAGVPVTVIEKRGSPGGLAAGFKRGGNHYDLGVHMLHGFDEEILQRIQGLMGAHSVPVVLDAKIRWYGRDFSYPLQFRDMVAGVPAWLLVRCVAGLLAAEARNKIASREPANAEEALVQLYGRPLYEFFFEEFTHRYWGTHPSRMSAAFVKTKMPRLAVKDAVVNALRKAGFRASTDFAVPSALASETLHYSRSGAEAMPRFLAAAIREAGGEVLLDREVTAVDVARPKGGVGVTHADRSGRRQTLDAKCCISTVPLPGLIAMLDPPPPTAVLDAAARLRYRSIVVYGLLVRRKRALDGLYVYFRDRMFHRVGEPKNAGMRVNPEDHTVLIVEMTCTVGDDRWNGERETVAKLLGELSEEGLCRPDQVVEQHIFRCAEAYPIFSLGFERHLDMVKDYVGSVPGLRSTGRQGDFCYPNMHAAMRMGADAAASAVKWMGTGGLDTAVVHQELSRRDDATVARGSRGR